MAFLINTDALREIVQDGITQRIEAIVSDEIEQVKKRVEARVRAEIGSIATMVLNRVSFESFRDELMIRVQIDQEGK